MGMLKTCRSFSKRSCIRGRKNHGHTRRRSKDIASKAQKSCFLSFWRVRIFWSKPWKMSSSKVQSNFSSSWKLSKQCMGMLKVYRSFSKRSFICRRKNHGRRIRKSKDIVSKAQQSCFLSFWRVRLFWSKTRKVPCSKAQSKFSLS